MCAFRVLGPIEAWSGGTRLALGGPQLVKLLAFLLLNANRAVSADAVIDAVWGAERDGAAKRLQMGVVRLRRALEPLDGQDAPRLRTVSGGYLLSVAPGELDAEVFAERALAARDGLDAEAGNPAHARELLSEALGLWRGPPYAEVAFEDFAQAEIRRLEELWLEALESRVDADLQLGVHARVVGELRALVAEHPTRERLASQLMLALYRCGRQADALEVYQQTRARLAEDLGLEPGPALVALQRQILEHANSLDLVPPARTPGGEDQPFLPPNGRPSSNLPVPPTPTLGRQREIARVADLLRAEVVRLVTLTGPGGVGKTRVALELARASESGFADGACWVELAGVTRGEDVAPTIVRALAMLPMPGETPRESLLRYLAGKRLLLVIDNFEHVIDAAELVGELLGRSTALKILVTSREPLDIAAEHRIAIGPLSLPDISGGLSVAAIEAAPATALFISAATRRGSNFVVTSKNAPAVGRICARLDGLPLAVELAAARTPILGIEELADRLALLHDLGTGQRDAPARQRTLFATIDWSYRLLDENEARAFARFAVFAGGATVAVAEQVMEAGLVTLEALVAKNLLAQRVAADGSARLLMLETIRQFASERLGDDPEQVAVRRRHLEAYLDIVERCTPQLSTDAEPGALATIDREIDNIRGALDWALEHAPDQALRIIGLLGEYFWICSNSDALPALEAAIRAASDQAPVPDRARAHIALAYQRWLRGDLEKAKTAASVALGLYESLQDDAGISAACCMLTPLSAWLGDRDAQLSFADRACEHARLAGDDGLLGNALGRLVQELPVDERPSVLEEVTALLTRSGNYRQLGITFNNCADRAMKEGRIPEALRLFEMSERAAAKMTTPWLHMRLVGNIGQAHLFDGNHEAARERFAQELQERDIHGFDSAIDFCLAGLAALAARDDQLERAAMLLGAARAAGYANPDDRVLEERLEHDFFAPPRARHGEEAWRRSEELGRMLPHTQALVYARETAGLTREERADIATQPQSSDAARMPAPVTEAID
jgi:predicted ATPase/DNA-binding SARP family transcriptional activator